MRQAKSNAERQAAFRRRRTESHAALFAAKGLVPLPSVETIPGWPRWRQVLAQTEQALRVLHREMQMYHDDRSDEWQDSEKAEEFIERMEAVEELIEQVVECRGHVGGPPHRKAAERRSVS